MFSLLALLPAVDETSIVDWHDLFKHWLTNGLKHLMGYSLYHQTLQRWLDFKVFGNTVSDWTGFVIIFLIIFGLFRLIHWLVVYRILGWMKNRHGWIQFFYKLLNQISVWVFVAFSMTYASAILSISRPNSKIIDLLPVLAIIFQLGLWGQPLILFLINRHIEKQHSPEARIQTLMLFEPLKIMFLIVFWALLGILALGNLGYNISALVTGLGVGGVAVALAVQSILSDLFAALSIVTDKPFIIGDFIIIDNFMGSVEHIGLKTTRLRSLSGEQIIFSNSDLLKSRIRNYKRMQERRIEFTFTVSYETTLSQLEVVPPRLKAIIEDLNEETATIPHVRFDRAHFSKYTPLGMEFAIVYFVLDADFNKYMDVQQIVNLNIYKLLQELEIEFASSSVPELAKI